jgi:hypothetical protein
MSSPSNPKSPPHSEGPKLHLSEPSLILEPTRTVIPLSHYEVEGVGSGNLDHLKFRPFADFHPVGRVTLTVGGCEVWYTKPLKPISERQWVKVEEVSLLLSQVVNARRRLVAKQPLYLFPGEEAFGVDPVSQRLRLRVINVRPRGRLQTLSHAQLTIEAFCALLSRRCPEGWARVSGHRERLTSLEALEALLAPRSAWSKAWPALRLTGRLLLTAALLSVPLAVWGPEPLRGELRARLVPPALRVVESVEGWLEGLKGEGEGEAGSSAGSSAGSPPKGEPEGL